MGGLSERDKRDEEICAIKNRLEILENGAMGLNRTKCNKCGTEVYSAFKEICPRCLRPIKKLDEKDKRD